MTAARRLATRHFSAMSDYRSAVHELGTSFLSLGMLAEVFEAEGAYPLRVDQLRRVVDEGRALTWRAGRLGRVQAGPISEFDVSLALAGYATPDTEDRVGPAISVCTDGPSPTLIDLSEFVAAIDAVIENSMLSGAETIQLRVTNCEDAVEVTFVDDGCGLPEDWPVERPLVPYESGWATGRIGLGLTEAAEFAEGAGGALEVSRREGLRGTCVLLRLPRAHSCISSDPRTAESTSIPAGPLEAQAEILEGIARRVPLAASLDAVIRAMEGQLEGSICSILLLDPASGTLSHGASPNLPDSFRRLIDGVRIGPRVGSCGTAAYTQRPVVAVDIAVDERWVDFCESAMRHGLRSCWSTPILDADRGEVLGTFAVYHASPWRPTRTAMDLVNRFTYTAAIAIGTHALFSQLQESESRFRSAFTGAAVGMAVTDVDGTLLQTNPALMQMLGCSGIGRRLGDFLETADAEIFKMSVRLAVAGLQEGSGETFRLPEVGLRSSGANSPLWAAMSGSLVADSDGKPKYFCIELFDLTERRRVAQARKEQAVAEAASQAKTDLLALVSHELRTPLNAVIGFAQLIQMGGLTPERHSEGVSHILTAGRHLLQLINDLLDMSGAETGQLELHSEPLSALTIIHGTVDMLGGLASDRSIELKVRVDEADLWVRADAQRLRQVLINLVGNAIKFTQSGGWVEISVRVDRITVTDSGPGIGSDDLSKAVHAVPSTRRAPVGGVRIRSGAVQSTGECHERSN